MLVDSGWSALPPGQGRVGEPPNRHPGRQHFFHQPEKKTEKEVH
jgi:hypothetical protein